MIISSHGLGLLIVVLFSIKATKSKTFDERLIEYDKQNSTLKIKSDESITCDWFYDEAETCSISCLVRAKIQQIAEMLKPFIENRTLCRTAFPKVKIELLNNIDIENGWIAGNIDIKDLIIFATTPSDLKPFAFNHSAFRRTTTLNITFPSLYLRTGSFYGLHSLVNLYIQNIYDFDPGILESVQTTMDYFIITGPVFPIIKDLFNSLEVNVLNVLDFRVNFGDLIVADNFIPFRKLLTLFLKNCQITSIGPGAFDLLNESIQVIDLTGNQLKTLPEGIFDKFSERLSVHIEWNPWHCDCDLLYLKSLINIVIKDQGKCETPIDLKGELILLANICDWDPTTNPYTTTTTQKYNPTETSITTKTTSELPTTINPDDFWTHKCLNENGPKDLNIKTHIRLMTLYKHKDGTIYLDFQESQNMLFIWLDSFTSKFSCLNLSNASMTWHTENCGGLCTICLMDKSSSDINPIDCVSVANIGLNDSNIWLTNDAKDLMISLNIVGLIISLIISSICGFHILRKKPILLTTNKRVLSISSTTTLVMPNEWYEKPPVYDSKIYAQPFQNIDLQKDLRTATADNKSDLGEVVPPLPPRNSKIFTVNDYLYEVINP